MLKHSVGYQVCLGSRRYLAKTPGKTPHPQVVASNPSRIISVGAIFMQRLNFSKNTYFILCYIDEFVLLLLFLLLLSVNNILVY